MLEINKSYLVIIVILLSIISCSESKKNQTENFNNKDSKKQPIIENVKVDSIDLLVEKYRDSLKLYKDDDFVRYIINFDGENNTYDQDLWVDKSFMKFHKQPLKNYNKAKILLADNDLHPRNKHIVSMSMYKLPLKLRLDLLEFSYLLFDKGIIDNTNLYYSIGTVVIENKPTFYVNYKNSKVREVLNNILNNDKTEDFLKHIVKQILSGEKYKKGEKLKWNWDNR